MEISKFLIKSLLISCYIIIGVSILIELGYIYLFIFMTFAKFNYESIIKNWKYLLELYK